jgi:hypothetical protein
MKKIEVSVDQVLFEWLESTKKTTVEQRVIDLLNSNLPKDQESVDEIFEAFQGKIKNIPLNFEFEVSQAFGLADWEKFSKSIRIKIGRRVRADCEIIGLEFVETTASRHAVYRRKN